MCCVGLFDFSLLYSLVFHSCLTLLYSFFFRFREFTLHTLNSTRVLLHYLFVLFVAIIVSIHRTEDFRTRITLGVAAQMIMLIRWLDVLDESDLRSFLYIVQFRNVYTYWKKDQHKLFNSPHNNLMYDTEQRLLVLVNSTYNPIRCDLVSITYWWSAIDLVRRAHN